MSEGTPLERLAIDEDPDAILELVRRDIQESYDFKRVHWNTDRVQNRRRAYRGDPAAYTWPYGMVSSSRGPRPVDNWTFRQINHKVGKLARVPRRVNLSIEGNSGDAEVRAQLAAVKRRLEQKARDAKWSRVRRKMLKDAAVEGLAARAIGLDLSGPVPRITSWPIRHEEWHRDPGVEMLEDAAWASWRRWVDETAVRSVTGSTGTEGAGSRMSLTPAGGPDDVEFPDDLILVRGENTQDGPYVPRHRRLLTDYFRKDPTTDVYYTCPECQSESTVGRVRYKGDIYPAFHCAKCDTTLKAHQIPGWDTMSQGLRYPHGRHIRVLGAGEVLYSGPNKLPLERVFPFLELPWYDSEYYPGYSEVELLNSPQVMNSVALAMIADNAIFNAHPKRTVLQGGLVKPDNNSPDDVIELTQEAVGTYTLHAPGGLGEAAKIMLEQSIHSTYALAGNDPVAHGAQPDTIRSGVGIARVVAASEVALYLLQDNLFDLDREFFEIVRDICREIDSPAMLSIPNEHNGLATDFAYDRTLMQPNVVIHVSADREIDQEREELFSRALELFTSGDPWMDWDLLHELSGIPADLIQQAMTRVRQRAAGLDPLAMSAIMQRMAQTGGGRPGGLGGGGNGAPIGGPPQPTGVNRLRQGFEGARAGGQVRPPQRSRGAQTATSPEAGRL